MENTPSHLNVFTSKSDMVSEIFNKILMKLEPEATLLFSFSI